MALIDYLNRSYDILAFPGVVVPGTAQLEQELFGPGNTGQIVTGILMLAQRWVIEFLTETGSLLYDPTRGTNFMTDARLGRFQTELSVIQSFNFALVDLQRNLQGEETSSIPNDERYASAELLKLALFSGLLQMTVQLNSVAGTAVNVILPVSTLP
jgi:hypothetical protein